MGSVKHGLLGCFFLVTLLAASGCGNNDARLLENNKILSGYLEAAIVQDLDIYKKADSEKVKRIAINGILEKLHALGAMRPVEDWHIYTLGAFCYLDKNHASLSAYVDPDFAQRSETFLKSVMPDVRRVAEEKRL